jgi:hypothetical protein
VSGGLFQVKIQFVGESAAQFGLSCCTAALAGLADIAAPLTPAWMKIFEAGCGYLYAREMRAVLQCVATGLHMTCGSTLKLCSTEMQQHITWVTFGALVAI